MWLSQIKQAENFYFLPNDILKMAGHIGNVYFVTFIVVLIEIQFCTGKLSLIKNIWKSDIKIIYRRIFLFTKFIA